MAHFAEINDEGIVQRVIVVGDSDTATSTGEEVESIGAEFCNKLLGGTWKQTSYNGNFRFRLAGKGHYFDESRDAFIPPQPYPSWKLDELSVDWDSPVPYPDAEEGEIYSWDESSLGWVKNKLGGVN
tara:strand:- start:67 stop:447 length:381 start_codon:yes stop_codon:yes gene_type:complete